MPIRSWENILLRNPQYHADVRQTWRSFLAYCEKRSYAPVDLVPPDDLAGGWRGGVMNKHGTIGGVRQTARGWRVYFGPA